MECHKALSSLYELKTIFLFFKEKPIGEQSNEYILKIIRNLEKENGLPPFNSVIENIIEEIYKKEKKDISDLKEAEILNFAKQIMIAWALPEKCFINLFESIKNTFYFQSLNKENRYALIEKKYDDKIVMYSEPVRYIIYDTLIGISSVESSNIKKLMKHFGII